MNKPTILNDDHYQQALLSLERTLDRVRGCTEAERQHLRRDWDQLQDMVRKLTQGRVEIVVFGEISTGKSALINALVGEAVAAVDVRGGWTKEVWHVAWNGCGYRLPGLASSEVVLVDTPGLNEVGGADRGQMAREAAERADLILFVTDSDLNETEFSAMLSVAAIQKPVILVFNKIDLYSPDQRSRLLEVLRDERVSRIVPPQNVVMTAADPRKVEYIIESADGSTRSEWRTPPPNVGPLKARILEILEKEGLALLALNGALYASDRSDRIAALRVQLRNTTATQAIWSYAAMKSIAVALNPIPVADVLGGTAVDVTMVITLSHIYGLDISWRHARQLVTSILKAAGWLAGVTAVEYTLHLAATAFKLVTAGYGTVLTAIPQGAAAGFGSYIVGHAAKHYFEHGSSWGGESPKEVVRRILEQTDRQSVLDHLKDEIRKRIGLGAQSDRGSAGQEKKPAG
jgi:small GTP-binding protein